MRSSVVGVICMCVCVGGNLEGLLAGKVGTRADVPER